ncbi:ABC transporter permease [Nocardioides sp.]|uniref:ABC transporter permease n=1 Tax=Nocardioides sp. TaxID=35761 RepID=UPI003D0B41D1
MSATPGRRSSWWLMLIARYGTLIGFALMLLVFSLTADSFFSAANLENVLKASAALGVLSIGLTIVLILGDFDLSIGYTATAAGMLAAGTAQSYGMAGGTVAALLVGVGVGLLNGLVVTRLGVSAFITTLGAGQIIAGWLIAYRGGIQISADLPADFTSLGRGSIGPIFTQVVVWLLVCVGAWLLLERTVIGRRMYAVGGNPVAARLSGINNERSRLLAFVLSGAFAGLAGLMVTSSLGVGNPTSAVSFLLPAFAACFIGAATLREGQFHVGGTVVGVLMLSFLSNGLVIAGVERAWTIASQGIVLVAAVTISTFARRVASR